jgi:hypothetical protein
MMGGGGADTLNGGTGGDYLDGGNDGKADILNGGTGDDILVVWANDIANGGDDSDIIILKDNLNFGSVDGGLAADVQDDDPDPTFNSGMFNHRGDILVFDGDLNFNGAGAAQVLTGRQVSGIETISMRESDGSAGDTTDELTLDFNDVIAMGTGTFNPDAPNFGERDAIRVDGDSGDVLNLTGGNWAQLATSDAPTGYNVFVHDTSGNGSAEDAYVLVQSTIAVHTS